MVTTHPALPATRSCRDVVATEGRLGAPGPVTRRDDGNLKRQGQGPAGFTASASSIASGGYC